MSEYVKKSEVKNALYEFLRPHSPIVIHLIDKAIDVPPTADVQEVRRAKWVYLYRLKKFVGILAVKE